MSEEGKDLNKDLNSTEFKLIEDALKSVVLDGFDELEVGRLAAAEGITFRHGSLVGAVAKPGAESKSLGFGGKFLRLCDNECIVRDEIFLEAVNVFIHDEVNGERV